MEPYREDRPFISIDTETSLLDRLLNAGIPLTRALKYFRDNPEGSALETLKLAAEDVVPFYGTYRNDGDWSDYAKEAAMFGVPMPYIKHPVTGKPIPNNLKEGLGNAGWASLKSKWKHNNLTRKLYANPEDLYYRGSFDGGLSSRSSVERNYTPTTAVETPAGPYVATNTGSNTINTGRQMSRTNTTRTRGGGDGILKGDLSWQGEMYPPGRRLRDDEMYGPYQWEDKYSRKLDAAIDENEYKWEYLINKTRPASDGRGSKAVVVPKQDIIDIALNQGRPDIAERVAIDDNPRIGAHDRRLNSYKAAQRRMPDEQWKDIGNRQIEKELRETFASLPNEPDIRYRFAEHYGVPDLFESWINDPLPWEKMKADTQIKRIQRERANRYFDRKYGRTIQR